MGRMSNQFSALQDIIANTADTILDARQALQDLAGVDVARGFRGVLRSGSNRSAGAGRTRRTGGRSGPAFRNTYGFDTGDGPFQGKGAGLGVVNPNNPFRGGRSSGGPIY